MHGYLIIDGPSELRSGPQENGPENVDAQRHAGETTSPGSLALHGQEWPKADVCGSIPGRGSSTLSDLYPDDDDNSTCVYVTYDDLLSYRIIFVITIYTQKKKSS